MTATVDQTDPTTLSALELLKRWAGIHGPDPRIERGNCRRGTLGLCRLTTYHRHQQAGRRATPRAGREDRADGRPHETVGVTTGWSANAPPALPSA
jgi:hypothetical protein